MVFIYPSTEYSGRDLLYIVWKLGYNRKRGISLQTEPLLTSEE
jgi:hypothetical protein